MTRELEKITGDEATTELIGYADTARPLLANGYLPRPIRPRTKGPPPRSWQSCTPDHLSDLRLQKEIDRYRDYGTGIVCGTNLVALDLDAFDPANVAEDERIIRSIVRGEPLVREGQTPRRILLYRTASSIPTRHFNDFDVLGAGSYFMAFGIHPTGRPYRWIGPSPLDVARPDLPVITPAQVEQIIDALVSTAAMEALSRPSKAGAGGDRAAPLNDGRDRLLTAIVYEVWCCGIDSLDELAAEAWRRFEKSANLSRPKRNGMKPWTIADARQKAKYLLTRAAAGIVQRSTGLGGELTYQTNHEPFARAVDALGARGFLSPGAVRLSQLMLCLCRNGGGCFASVGTLARQLDFAEGSVKRLRARLVAARLWACRTRGHGRGTRSEYVPCAETATAEAEKVTLLGTLITSRKRGDGSEEREEPGKLPCVEDFISLGGWTAGGVA